MELDLLVCGALIALSWMTIGFFYYLARKNPAIIDLFWTLCVFFVSLFYFLSGNFTTSAGLAFSLVILWTLKLSILLIYKLRRDHVDRRYERLDKKWKERKTLKYFVFFLVQAVGAYILVLPLFFSSQALESSFRINTFGFTVSLIGFIGEGIADFQLQKFLSKKRKKVCDVGLWAYSRHPNYFFEWIFWIGIFLLALNSPFGWISLISPVFLLVTLLFFTGIPPNEEQALASKGRAYKKYQKRVSVFIPWFLKFD